VVDRFQHGVLHAQAPIIQTLTRIVTDDGAAGYCLAWIIHGEIERAARRSQRSCPGCPVARCKRTWVSS